MSGCGSDQSPDRSGTATVRLDGVRLGRGGQAAPFVSCFGGLVAMPTRIEPEDRFLPWGEGDWVARRGPVVQVGMDLRLTATDPPSATITVTVGEAVYHTAITTDVTLDAGWTGSASFDGLELATGPDGSASTITFDIAWSCDVRED